MAELFDSCGIGIVQVGFKRIERTWRPGTPIPAVSSSNMQIVSPRLPARLCRILQIVSPMNLYRHSCFATMLCITLLATLFLGNGCGTTDGDRTPDWEVIAKIAARRGTVEALRRHPEYRLAFEATATGLDQLLLQDQVDYQQLHQVLAQLPIKELRGDEGALLVADAIDLYDASLGRVLRLNETSRLRPIAEALRDGIRGGLALTGSSSSAPPMPAGFQGPILRQSVSRASPGTVSHTVRTAWQGDHLRVHHNEAPPHVTVELSEDLVHWRPALELNRSRAGALTLLDYDTQNAAKFYRVVPR